ncbi:MAG TPA: phosphate ABC transporter ATP-binding protein [Chloroflexota bacterium]|nr:phosphate ABC transporter ATP-binding protein [Chloroflexota bacterium]
MQVDGSAPANGRGATVDLRNVNAWYGGAPALRDVTLTVAPRAVTALIGPSGCGKTTLLRSINRLNDTIPSYRLTGSLTVLGQEVYGKDLAVEDLRRRVGMLFQRPVPLPMSIYDDVAYGPRLHRLAGSRAGLDAVVEESLRMAALWDEVKDRLHHPGRSLSGGQQQRLCLARALAVKPRVILMDEPCAALDPGATAKIEELIRQLCAEITVIIVTHNLAQARRIADFTAVMLPSANGGGELAEFGLTPTIFETPTEPRTADYVAGRFG